MDNLDDLRLQVAKALGWKWYHRKNTQPTNENTFSFLENFDEAYEECAPPEKPIHWHWRIPDWPNDWSATMELEDSIPELKRGAYVRALMFVTGNAGFQPVMWELIHATPEQRCRAWLACKGANDGKAS